jgi:ABC-2 type transport system permease protein
MGKILLILQREYLVRVRKKSFIIMTILGPILIGGLYAGAIWLAVREGGTQRTIEVIDQGNLFSNTFESQKNLTFMPSTLSLEEAKQGIIDERYYAVLHIPDLNIDNPSGIRLYAKKQIGLEDVNAVENYLKRKIEDLKLIRAGIDKQTLASIDTRVSVSTVTLSVEEGEKGGSAAAAMIAGFAAAFIIYISIFIYGVQVMRGVIEEKTNRIVEVIISSVKPFQLMLGKITGIALVGLTQFFVWIVFGFILSGIITGISGADQLAAEMTVALKRATVAGDMMNSMLELNFPLLIGCFLFYFLGGYLLYSAMFAAVGAAADSETDTQQFMLPITIPLIMAFVLAQAVIRSPDGTLAFWLSMIPLTSPIIMMVRLPFGVPPLELITSMLLLAGGFLGVTWLAARIYRVGILMYGKKVNYRELTKWIFYRS